jgi:hypothetical protein
METRLDESLVVPWSRVSSILGSNKYDHMDKFYAFSLKAGRICKELLNLWLMSIKLDKKVIAPRAILTLGI